MKSLEFLGFLVALRRVLCCAFGCVLLRSDVHCVVYCLLLNYVCVALCVVCWFYCVFVFVFLLIYIYIYRYSGQRIACRLENLGAVLGGSENAFLQKLLFPGRLHDF